MREELEKLTPEELRRVYRMLRLEVSARPDRMLEARVILGESIQVSSESGVRFAILNLRYRASRT